MKAIEKFQALEIASKHNIRTVLSWWNAFSNVQWEVLKSSKKLSHEQYYYLSHNKLIEPKKEIKKGEEIILKISELGKSKLLKMKDKLN